MSLNITMGYIAHEEGMICFCRLTFVYMCTWIVTVYVQSTMCAFIVCYPGDRYTYTPWYSIAVATVCGLSEGIHIALLNCF